MTKNTPLNDFLGSVAVRGMSLLGVSSEAKPNDPNGLIVLCKQLLSTKGNASGLALAQRVLEQYSKLDSEGKTNFFLGIVDEFGCDGETTQDLAQQYAQNPTQELLQQISDSATPKYAQLISRLNQRPASTLSIVHMRADLLAILGQYPALKPLDSVFKEVFSSWFNRGFLRLQKIDWHATGAILENIIRYEAVHGIAGWDDLARRIKPNDRTIYGFFHHNLEDEPLIFVEVALTTKVPTSIETILSESTPEIDPSDATTAVFYSISNCQYGLRGVELGNFLIKQVVSDLQQRHPNLKEFVTLSPIPKFAEWMKKQSLPHLELPNDVSALDENDASGALMEAAAWFLSEGKGKAGLPLDPVCKFHIGNGAMLEQINWGAQKTPGGLQNSFGIMANYKYLIDNIEKNHENFVTSGNVATSQAVKKLAKKYSKNASTNSLNSS